MRLTRTTLASLVFVMLATAAVPACAQIRIGILAGQDIHQALQPWHATGEHLSRRLGQTVTLIPLNQAAVEPAIRSGHIDFVLLNTTYQAALAAKYGLTPLAEPVFTLSTPDPESAQGSVIFVRRDSSIKSVEDIRGSRFMCVKFSSYSGALAAWRFLKSRGLDPQTECASFREGGTHEAVVEAVRDGDADVGVVRGGILARMQSAGQIDLDAFRILYSTADEFSLDRAANPPGWILSAIKADETRLTRQLTAVLLEYRDDADTFVSSWLDIRPDSKLLPSP